MATRETIITKELNIEISYDEFFDSLSTAEKADFIGENLAFARTEDIGEYVSDNLDHVLAEIDNEQLADYLRDQGYNVEE